LTTEWVRSFLNCPGCGKADMASNLHRGNNSKMWEDVCLSCEKVYQIRARNPLGLGMVKRIKEELTT